VDNANCNAKLKCSTGGPGLCCTSFDCDRFKNAKLCLADDFYLGLSKSFDASWTINLLDIDTNRTQPLCNYYFGPMFCPFQKSIDALVPYVAGWVKHRGFDELYLDEFFPSASIAFPLSLLANISFDADGDGKPETVADLVAQFHKFKPLMAAELRKALGDEAIILANTVVGEQSSALNGFTIEMESCTGSNYDKCLATVEAQYKISVQPAMAIMWLTGESASNPAAAQCARVAQIQAQLPWVMEGTDFYDGSHVTCNRTRLKSESVDTM
jgi:hypothetical protein